MQEAADGRREEPLPDEVPRDDLEHMTPRDLRAAWLAGQLEGRSRWPAELAEELAKIEERER